MAIDRVRRFIGAMGRPQQLQELGVNEQDLTEDVQLALLRSTVQADPQLVNEVVRDDDVFRAAK